MSGPGEEHRMGEFSTRSCGRPVRRGAWKGVPVSGRAKTVAGLPILVSCLALLAAACSSPEEPVDDSLPAEVSAYQYLRTTENRYFELRPVPDTCGGCADTLVDSVWRVYTEDSVYWAQSYRAIRHFRFDSASSTWLVLGDENASGRREGVLADSLLLDPSLRFKLLVAPVQAGTQWFVDDSGAIQAQIVGEETLPLGVGNTRSWHVLRGAVGDEWWAPALGRVQYEEVLAGGARRSGRLIGLGVFP
jgi:hypothetical protein